jgi:hypothetical protein
MTAEEKELLLKDLSARQPYGVMFQYQTGSYNSTVTSDYFPMVGIIQNAVVLDIKNRGLFNLSLEDSQCKPYLRPLSSMTEDEKDIYDRLVMCNAAWVVMDWLNENHFDYHKLIEKGLAIEAPEGMYNFK